MDSVSESLARYTLHHGIFHGLATPDLPLVVDAIESWLRHDDSAYQQQALLGVLLTLGYPRTVDQGFEILNRSDHRIRNILGQIVPFPLQTAATLFAEYRADAPLDLETAQDRELYRIFDVLKQFEIFVQFLATVFAADALNQRRLMSKPPPMPKALRSALSMATGLSVGQRFMGFISLSNSKDFTPSLVALSALPEGIQKKLHEMINTIRRARNELAHGSGELEAETIQLVADHVWELKLLLFCFCDWRVDYRPIGTQEVDGEEVRLSEPVLQHVKCGEIPLWPFYIVARTAKREGWLFMERNRWFNRGDRSAVISKIELEPVEGLPVDPKERKAAIRRRIFTVPPRQLGFVIDPVRSAGE